MLEKEGHEVAKFSMAHPENLPDKYEKYFVSNVDFNNFKFGSILKIIGRVLWSWEAARKFEKLIFDFKPDIIHLHNIYHQISPSIIKVAKKHSLPVIMHLHDYKLICPNYKLFAKGEICYRCKGGKYYQCTINKCLKNSFLKSLLATIEMYLHHKVLKIYDKIDLFIAPSRFMKNICVEFGAPEEKIRVVHNFVLPTSPCYLPGRTRATNAGHANDGAPSVMRRGRHANEGDYLLYFGRLSEEKGIDVLLEAMRKADVSIKLKIVGEGPEEEKLKVKSEKLKAGNRVEFVGPKYGEELQNLINGAKAIVIPSVWPENMPLSLLESMAIGKMVIASRIGGIPEIIKDGENGFLFKPGDADDLADKINRINRLAEKEIGKTAVHARSSIENFNPQKHIGEITEIYKQYVQ